ncbi:MAG: hypothetical protein KC619_27200, partial [Myxococcales bacterium]|nr:hypothetical protein [Myxococcales bacterium]
MRESANASSAPPGTARARDGSECIVDARALRGADRRRPDEGGTPVMSMQTRNRPPIQQDARRPQPRPPTALPRSRGTHAVSLLSLASAATLFVLTLLAAATPTHALATRMGVHDLRTLDADWAAELAGFPADARDAAYVVAGQPETLMRVAEIQQDSVQAFRALVEPLPREDQETVWDLVRHPGLVADLARDGRKSDAQLDALASQYPDESHAGILAAGGRLYPTWVRIHALDLDVERQLDTLLADQSVAYRDAFDVVTARPELVGLLVDDLEATTLLGAIQRENPEAVDTFFATLHDEVVARRAEEDRAWSAALEDPETAEEARAAARAFAADYGYAYDDATWARTRARSTTVVNVSISPFPFWFGYPTWYDVAYWYPASVWGYAGFYYGPSYASFYYAPRPSALFFGWYTRHTGHHHRYAPPRYAYRSHHAPRYTHRGPTPTTRGFRSGYRTASNHVDFLRARARQASYEPVRHRRVENRSRFEQRAPGADGRHGWDWRDRRGDTGRDRPDGRRDDRSRSSTDGRRDDRDHSSFDGRRDDRGGADFDGRRDDRRGRGGSPSARDSDRSRDRSRGHLSDFVTQSERRSRDGSSSTPRNRSETPRAERDRSGRGSAPPAVDTRSGGDERRSRRGGDGQVDSMRRSRGGDGQ